uniref:Uncharacterized protein n=1 Tax=Avena sativa TaxID=4498 RepID=A0ACD5TF34_AVESA
MGRRPDRSAGALACCRVAVIFAFLVFALLLVVMVATTSGVGATAAAPPSDGRTTTSTTRSSSGPYSGNGHAGEDPYRSSKRRIPKGPDPIHNRRAGKTTIAPRRRD